MAKITPIYQFYTHELGDILYAYNDENNMLTTDRQIGGLYNFIGQGVRVGWEVTKLVADENYSSVLNETIRKEQIELIDAYIQTPDSYLGRRITTMRMQPRFVCKAGTTSNLNAIYNSTNATLTNNSSFARLSIDSFQLSNGEFVLVKNQTVKTQNGIYVVTNQGSNSQNWILTRVSELNTTEEFRNARSNYNCFWVIDGKVNFKTVWNLDINKNTFILNTNDIIFRDGFEQCVRVSTGDGIVGLYKAKTEENVYFRYFETEIYYVWATASPCLASESKTLIVSPLTPDYNYDSYNVAVYLASVQVNGIFESNNVRVDTIEYDDRRNKLQNLEGIFELALRKAFYRHVHLGGPDHPSKINLSTTRVLYARGPIGSTIFRTFDERGNQVFSWNPNQYGFPEVRLNGFLLKETQYNLSPSSGRIFLKNSVDVESIIQITLPLSPQKKLFLKPGSNITDDKILLTENPSAAEPTTFRWDSGFYLEPIVYFNGEILSSAFYRINPSEGSIRFINLTRSSSDTFFVLIESIGREITGNLNASRLRNLDASLFTKNELKLNRLAPLDHVGLVRLRESALLRPTKRLFSFGDQLRFYPEDTSQDLQYGTEIYTINTSVNKPNSYLFGTKRGLYSGTSFTKVNFDSSWNTDDGEVIDISDNIMRSIEVNGTRNKFKTIFILTKQGKVFRSFDNGSSWSRLKMPFIQGSQTQILATAFLASTQIEPIEERNRIVYKYSTLLYLGTNIGLFTATIQENESDADWAWSYTWSNVSGNKRIYAIGEIVTQKKQNQQFGGAVYEYERTIYIGSDKGFTVHEPTGVYDSTRLVTNEPTKGFLWITSQSPNNLLWFTDNKVYISHTARFFEIESENSTQTYWTRPLQYFSTSKYSTANKVECKLLLNENLESFTAAPNEVDGIQLSVNDLILVRNQIDFKENGIYKVTSVGTGSNGEWTNVSETHLTSTNKWVFVTSGDNWGRSSWTYLLTDLSLPANFELDAGEDYLRFEELYINPIFETQGTIYFQKAVERTTSNQFILTSKENPWIISDRRVFNTPNEYEWDYPIVLKVNWNSNLQSQINTIYFTQTQPQNLYVGTKEGLYYTTNINSLLSTTLVDDLDISDELLFVKRASSLLGYSIVELNSPTQSLVIEVSVTTEIENNNTIYTVTITSSPTRTAIFPATTTSAFPIQNNKKITNVTWRRLTSQIIANSFPNIYNEQEFGISTDERFLTGKVENFELNENFQIIQFQSEVDLGKSFIYENEFISYYVDPWDTDANVFIYMNDRPAYAPYTVYPSEGRVSFAIPNSGPDEIEITIIKLNKYLLNTGFNPHAELSNSFKTGVFLTYLQQDLEGEAEGGKTQIFVQNPENIPLNTNLLVLIYRARGVEEKINVKVTTNIETNVREIYLLNTRPKGSITLLADATEVYSVIVGTILGIEDKITEAYSNQYYNFNSIGGANLAQLSIAAESAEHPTTKEILLPKLFDKFFSEPMPVYAEQATRGPKNYLFYNFAKTPADVRNSITNLSIGIEPNKNNTPHPPTIFYLIYNASSSGESLRLGTNNGIWIYKTLNQTWTNETTLSGSSKVYFIKQQEGSSYLMAGTDLGLFEQQQNNTWSLNSFYPQAIYDHSSGDWGEDYTFTAFGKSDGLAFVRTKKSTGEFISDHFDPVDEKNVYGLYKQKFFRLVDDGQGGTKQVLVDAIYLCTNVGLFGVCEGFRSGNYASILAGREMFGNKPNRVSIELPDGTRKLVSIKYYKIFNSPKPQRNNQPPVPIIILTSNGVYTIINWRWCDPADAGTSDFTIANHNLVGISCTCFATATEQIGEEKFIYKTYVGTNIGVFRSYDDGRNFERCERINFEDTAINDIKSLGPNCILVATSSGLFYSNDEGDTWYKTDEAPDFGTACTTFRSSVDAGEYFKNGYLAQTFIPASDKINKVSLFLSRDDVESTNLALENVITVGIYNTVLQGSNYVPDLSSPLVVTNVSTTTVGYDDVYNANIGSLIATKKFTDNLEYDKKTYESSINNNSSGFAGITAIYDLTTSKYIDQMICQIYYTQNATLTFDYSDTGLASSWQTISIFKLPIHAGAGSWEDIIWKLSDSEIDGPSDLRAVSLGSHDNLATYSYKVTSLTYLGESTASTVTKIANSTLTPLTRVSLVWTAVPGAYKYKVYGRTNGAEKYLGEVIPNGSTVIFIDDGTGPAVGADSPPLQNTTANIGNHIYYRLSLKDDLDPNLTIAKTRDARIADFRIYYENIQFRLPEKLSAYEIDYPGFKSFIINVENLSTSTTYALVARELDSDENEITNQSNRIVKWTRSNL